MRIILLLSPLPTRKLPTGPVAPAIFSLIDNFSCGPVGQWAKRQSFYAEREAYLKRISALDLPDGDHLEYREWAPITPPIDIEAALRGDVEVPDFVELSDLLKVASSVEVFMEEGRTSEVPRWYALAYLADHGFAAEQICTCTHPNFDHRGRDEAMIMKLLENAPDRKWPLAKVSNDEMSRAVRNWEHVVSMTRPADNGQSETPDEQKTFDIMAGRRPNPQTGLTKLHERLLQNTQPKRQRMARVIGNALCAGFDEGDWVGDMHLRGCLEELATMSPPLVEIFGEGPMHLCEVRLTEAGAEVLASLPH